MNCINWVHFHKTVYCIVNKGFFPKLNTFSLNSSFFPKLMNPANPFVGVGQKSVGKKFGLHNALNPATVCCIQNFTDARTSLGVWHQVRRHRRKQQCKPWLKTHIFHWSFFVKSQQKLIEFDQTWCLQGLRAGTDPRDDPPNYQASPARLIRQSPQRYAI